MRRLAAALVACLAAPALALAGEGFGRLEGHGGPVKGVAVSADGTRALTASFDYSVGLWDLEGLTLLRWLEGHRAAVNAVAFLPGGRAVSAGDDFDAILWELDSGRRLATLSGHRGKIIALRPDAEGRRLLTAGWDGRAGLWSLADPQAPPVWLEGHKGPVNDALFLPGGGIATASADGTIRLWEGDGTPGRVLVRHGFGINLLEVSGPEGWLAYGAVDGGMRAVEIATGRELADLTTERRPILAMAIAPDGARIAIGDGEGYITVIDTRGWRITRDFRAALRGPIWALDWDPAGVRLIAGGIEAAVPLWPLGAEGEPLLTAAEPGFLRDPDEMPNGERQFMRKCSICHSLTPGHARRAGPSLHGLFGRRAGTAPGYAYSSALTGLDLVWTDETVDRLFAEGPDVVTPGSKMPVQRITRAQDRQDLIGFLRAHTGGAAGATAKGPVQ